MRQVSATVQSRKQETSESMAAKMYTTAELIIGFVFCASAAAKIANPRRFYDGLRGYRLLPAKITAPAAILIIGVELLVGITHLTGYLLKVMAPAGLLLMLVFTVAVSIKLAHGDRVPCHCFGESDERVSWKTLERLALLMICELLIVLTWASRARYQTTEGDRIFAFFWSIILLITASWFFAAGDLLKLFGWETKPSRELTT